tara:strand:- start:191 stop:628 length:438 start_codon:yes stop_codon:yes gene_type:complete
MNEINILNNHSEHSINKKNLKIYCKDVLNYNGYNSYSISLIFVEQDELKEMKNKYFKKNVYTDVIAFNLNEDNEELDGELYLSLKTIENNATLYNDSLENEIKRVVAHGLLHLIGYEDNNIARKKEMTKIEDNCIKLFKHINLIC